MARGRNKCLSKCALSPPPLLPPHCAIIHLVIKYIYIVRVVCLCPWNVYIYGAVDEIGEILARTTNREYFIVHHCLLSIIIYLLRSACVDMPLFWFVCLLRTTSLAWDLSNRTPHMHIAPYTKLHLMHAFIYILINYRQANFF